MEHEGVGTFTRFGLIAEIRRALMFLDIGSLRPDGPVEPVARSWSTNERSVVLYLRRDACTRMSGPAGPGALVGRTGDA